jgi:hypothetical protein
MTVRDIEVVICTLEMLIDVQKGKITEYTEKMIQGSCVSDVMQYRDKIRFRQTLISELKEEIKIQEDKKQQRSQQC